MLLFFNKIMLFFKKKVNCFSITNLNNVDKKPDAVFFDYDGTISDNSKYLVKAFNYTIKVNFDKKKDKKLIKAIKKIKKDSEKWSYIKKNCPLKVFAKCNEDYDNYIARQKICIVKGILNVLKFFKKHNIPMMVVSQKRGDGLRNELKRVKLDKYFVKAYGTLDFGEAQKPSKEFVNSVRKDSKTKTKFCWMIGDRCSDVETGLNMNGVIFIIDDGEAEKIYKEHADKIGKKIFFTKYRTLLTFLKKMFKN